MFNENELEGYIPLPVSSVLCIHYSTLMRLENKPLEEFNEFDADCKENGLDRDEMAKSVKAMFDRAGEFMDEKEEGVEMEVETKEMDIITKEASDIYEARDVLASLDGPVQYQRYSPKHKVIYVGFEPGQAETMFAQDASTSLNKEGAGELIRVRRGLVHYPVQIKYMTKKEVS